MEGKIPANLIHNESLELLYIHVNNFKGKIPEVYCQRENPMKFLFYNNGFCPPFPDCMQYIGKQDCKN